MAVEKLFADLAHRIERPTYGERVIEEIVSAYRTGERSGLDAACARSSDELISRPRSRRAGTAGWTSR